MTIANRVFTWRGTPGSNFPALSPIPADGSTKHVKAAYDGLNRRIVTGGRRLRPLRFGRAFHDVRLLRANKQLGPDFW